VKIHLYTYKTTYSEDVCSLHTCFSAYLLHNAMRKFGTFFFGPPGIYHTHVNLTTIDTVPSGLV